MGKDGQGSRAGCIVGIAAEDVFFDVGETIAIRICIGVGRRGGEIVSAFPIVGETVAVGVATVVLSRFCEEHFDGA